MTDTPIRQAAFAWLQEQVAIHGDVLDWALLAEGFEFHGQHIRLAGQPGIFKPKGMVLPLSIRTSADGIYADTFRPDGPLDYCYRTQGGPNHPDNVALREAMRGHVPLVYLHGHIVGRYHVLWPVYIVGDDALASRFTVAVESELQPSNLREGQAKEGWTEIDRRYATSLARRRLHQRAFRERVVHAYGHRCALCKLNRMEAGSRAAGGEV